MVKETIKDIILNELNLNDFKNWNNKSDLSSDDIMIYVGWISKYDYVRGYGFIVDLIDYKEHFFHVSDLSADLFNTDDIYNYHSDFILNRFKMDLDASIRKSKLYEKYKRKMLDENIEVLQVKQESRFGTYKIIFKKHGEYVSFDIEDGVFTGIPNLIKGQIVCFRLVDDKAKYINIPPAYKHNLLNNCSRYSNELWDLLFSFIPSLLCTIEYEGFDLIDEQIEIYRKKIEPKIKMIKNLNLNKYINLDNYTLNLENYNGATTRDWDPNFLTLSCDCKDADDSYTLSHFSKRVEIAYESSYGSVKTLDYSINSVKNDYREEYINYVKDCMNGVVGNLVERNFRKTKEQWKNEFLSKYSREDHLLYYLNSLKQDFIKSCHFTTKHVRPEFDRSSEIVFKYNNSLKRYGNTIEFSRTTNGRYYGIEYYNLNYSLSYYDFDRHNKLNKYSICFLYINGRDKDMDNIDRLNWLLKKKLEERFNEFIEECLNELNNTSTK